MGVGGRSGNSLVQDRRPLHIYKFRISPPTAPNRYLRAEFSSLFLYSNPMTHPAKSSDHVWTIHPASRSGPVCLVLEGPSWSLVNLGFEP